MDSERRMTMYTSEQIRAEIEQIRSYLNEFFGKVYSEHVDETYVAGLLQGIHLACDSIQKLIEE